MGSEERPSCGELALEGDRLYWNAEYNKAVDYFERAVKCGTDDLKLLSAIYCQLGNTYKWLNDYVKAVQYFHHDRTLARSLGDLVQEGKANSNLGNTLKLMGKFDEAIVYCQQHLELCKQTNSEIGEAHALYSLANIYHVRGRQKNKLGPAVGNEDSEADLNLAVQYYLQNLAIARRKGERAAIGITCGSLGNTYFLLGKLKEAIMFHTERLSIAQEFGDKVAQRKAYTNLGNCHLFTEKYQVAAEFYLQTLSISRQLGDQAFEAQACYSLGSTYNLIKDYKRSVEYHLRHKQIAQELSDHVGVARSCWALSLSHASMGNSKKAVDFAQQHLNVSTEIGDEAGKLLAEKNLKELLTNQAPLTDTPSSRRRSMENLELLRLTPKQAANGHNDHNGKSNGDSLSSKDIGISLSNSTNGFHDNGSQEQPSTSSSSNNHDFLDLLTRMQGRRMNDQRADMARDEDLLTFPAFLEQHRPPPQLPREEAPNDVADEHHEKMNNMISMLARSQSKRLNEQRVSLSSLPGLRITDQNINMAANRTNNPDEDLSDRNNNAAPETLDENFFDNLMRCQGTRLNDQRTSAPPEGMLSPPTIPDEDVFSLVMRMQSSRINDQRCRFELPDEDKLNPN